jgi:actin-related protein
MINIFNSKDNVNIIDPIPLIISGGTSLPKGFMNLFEQEVNSVNLPFKYTKIIPAKDRLSSVSKGCMLWSNNIENSEE